MSKIDELIAQHCPDGVDYFPVAELFDLRNGYTPSKSNPLFWSDGRIPWFRMEDLRENGGVLSTALQQIPEVAVKGGKLFPANSLLVATSATIGEHALVTVPHLSNQRFTSLSPKHPFIERIDMKFAYYYGFVLDAWCLNNTTTSSFASVDMVGFKKFKFPVPPLEIQREIVRILDTFSKMEAELEAELEARKQQYAHYRNTLITVSSAPRKTMGELGNFVRGRRFTKNDVVESGIPSIHYGEIYTHYGVAATSALREIRSDLLGQLRFAQPNEVIFAGVGETVEDVGKAVAWLGKSPIAIHDDTFSFSSNLNPKYVSYAVQTDEFQSQKGSFVARGKVKRLSSNGLAKMVIPVPPIDEQRRIVDILGKFDALVNDLSVGIPAELTARRQQYEYFRDKLLTFKELESAS